jgi:ribosomal-protein-alanine N-acetyltransferase
VEANIIPRNAASIGLVKKLGFRYEGTAERYLRIAGVWEDHERWGMTVERWTA